MNTDLSYREQSLKKLITLCCISVLLLIIYRTGAEDRKTAAAGQEKAIFVCVSEDAPQALKDVAATLCKNAEKVHAIKALLETGGARKHHDGKSAKLINSEELLRNLSKKKNYNRAAFNHLIVIGLPEDPILKKCNDHNVLLNSDKKRFFRYGYGDFTGDIGWIDSDRNPFEYSRRISTAPYTTLITKLTGTSAKGVLAAAKSFNDGILNGAVDAGNGTGDKATLNKKSLLDGNFEITAPPVITEKLPEGLVYAGWTQPDAKEYRAFLDYGAPEPQKIWRIKYLSPKALEGVELVHWNNSFHRKAFGNAVMIAEFADSKLAGDAYNAFKNTRDRNKPLATEINLHSNKALCIDIASDMGNGKSPGKIYIVTRENYLIFSTVPNNCIKPLTEKLP